MANSSFNSIRHRLGSRTAVVVAGAVGFAIGATGFVAAQDGQPEPVGADATLAVDGTVAATVPEATADTTPDSTLLSPTTIDITIPTLPTESTIDHDTSSTAPDVTIDDTTDDTIDDTAPDTTADDSTSSTAPDTTIDDNDENDDDTTSSTAPDTTVDDTTPARTSPAPFSETYASAGGSISVSWSGTAFSLDSISPAGGFVAEIEDNAWDRIRVDFEGDDDFRIEVRLNDGAIRVRID